MIRVDPQHGKHLFVIVYSFAWKYGGRAFPPADLPTPPVERLRTSLNVERRGHKLNISRSCFCRLSTFPRDFLSQSRILIAAACTLAHGASSLPSLRQEAGGGDGGSGGGGGDEKSRRKEASLFFLLLLFPPRHLICIGAAR